MANKRTRPAVVPAATAPATQPTTPAKTVPTPTVKGAPYHGKTLATLSNHKRLVFSILLLVTVVTYLSTQIYTGGSIVAFQWVPRAWSWLSGKHEPTPAELLRLKQEREAFVAREAKLPTWEVWDESCTQASSGDDFSRDYTFYILRDARSEGFLLAVSEQTAGGVITSLPVMNSRGSVAVTTTSTCIECPYISMHNIKKSMTGGGVLRFALGGQGSGHGECWANAFPGVDSKDTGKQSSHFTMSRNKPSTKHLPAELVGVIRARYPGIERRLGKPFE